MGLETAANGRRHGKQKYQRMHTEKSAMRENTELKTATTRLCEPRTLLVDPSGCPDVDGPAFSCEAPEAGLADEALKPKALFPDTLEPVPVLGTIEIVELVC